MISQADSAERGYRSKSRNDSILRVIGSDVPLQKRRQAEPERKDFFATLALPNWGKIARPSIRLLIAKFN